MTIYIRILQTKLVVHALNNQSPRVGNAYICVWFWFWRQNLISDWLKHGSKMWYPKRPMVSKKNLINDKIFEHFHQITAADGLISAQTVKRMITYLQLL